MLQVPVLNKTYKFAFVGETILLLLKKTSTSIAAKIQTYEIWHVLQHLLNVIEYVVRETVGADR